MHNDGRNKRVWKMHPFYYVQSDRIYLRTFGCVSRQSPGVSQRAWVARDGGVDP